MPHYTDWSTLGVFLENGKFIKISDLLNEIDVKLPLINTNSQNNSNNTSNILTNTNNISTNTSNILTNTNNISTNTSNILTNTNNISTNTTNISTNTSNVSTNTSNISTNTSNISTNTSNITTNTSNISTNTSNISTNTSNIITNTSNISTNTSNISTNTSNISTNTSNISTNTSNITYNTSYLNNLQINNDIVTINFPVILINWVEIVDGQENSSLRFNNEQLQFQEGDQIVTRYGKLLDIYDLLNKEGYNYVGINDGTPTGSVKDYYSAISHGKLKVNFVILNASENQNLPIDILSLGSTYSFSIDQYAYTINGNYVDYGETNDSRANLLKPQLLLAYDKAKSNYDSLNLPYINHNDSNFDLKFGDFNKNVIFIHAGYGAETYIQNNMDYIWSHNWKFFDQNNQQINYNINPYKKNNNQGTDPKIIPIGVISHDTLHAFGLPDLYDTDNSSKGVGYLSIMGTGSWGTNKFSPWLPAYAITWTRSQLNNYFNTNICEITQSSDSLELPPIHETNLSYKLKHPTENDYWLIEYRTNIGFDRNMPCGGLVIWHVTDRSNNKNEFPSSRKGESGYKISLEQKDGLFDLEKKKNVSPCDVWVPGEEFSPYTVPSTVSINGKPSGIRLYDIEEDTIENRMKFKVEFIDIPTAKIVSVFYNFDQNDNLDHIPTLNHSDITDNNWIKINTINVPNGTKINSIKVNNIDWLTGIIEINNNEVEIPISSDKLQQIPTSQGSGNKPSFNIVSIKIDNLFIWNDCLKGKP